MHHWLLSLAGGALIGLSASLAWTFAQRITGVSGILGGVLRQPRPSGFRAGFLLGLVGTGLVLGAVAGPRLSAEGSARSLGTLVVAGLLVGFGTQLGGGCTSGHGVCGVSRLAPRSLLATIIFVASAALVVFVTRHVAAGMLP